MPRLTDQERRSKFAPASERSDADGAEARRAAPLVGMAAPIGSAMLLRKLARRRAAADEPAATVQLKAGNQADVPSGSESSIAESGFSGTPSALPYRGEMEAGFGQSFEGVKVHTGPQARAASEALGAEAYTFGNQVAFRGESPSREVVAHELAHTLQQAGGTAVQTFAASDPDLLEQEADLAAAAVVAGGTAEVALTTSGGGEKGVQKWAGSDHYAIGNLGGQKALRRFRGLFPDAEAPGTKQARVFHPTANRNAMASGVADTMAVETGKGTSVTLGEASRFDGDYADHAEGIEGRNREGGAKKDHGLLHLGALHELAAMVMTAATNSNHFYPINAMEWAHHHAAAIAAALAGDMEAAMHHEGFAAHFLQDTFSAGHFAPRSLDSIPHLQGKMELLPHDAVNGLMRSRQWHDFFCMLPGGLPTNRGRFHGDSYMDGNDLEVVSNTVSDSMLEVLAAGQGKPVSLNLAAQIPKPDIAAILADPVAGPVWRLMQDSYRADFEQAREKTKDGDKGKTAGGTEYSSKQVLELIGENIMGEGAERRPATRAEAVDLARTDARGAIEAIHHYVIANFKMQRIMWQDSDLDDKPKKDSAFFKLQDLEKKFKLFSSAEKRCDALSSALTDYLAVAEGPGREQAEHARAVVGEVRRALRAWHELVDDAGSILTWRESTIEKYRDRILRESDASMQALGELKDMPPEAVHGERAPQVARGGG